MTETKKNITAAPDSNSADVVIDGKVLTLTGSDPGYLQQVAKYIDETIAGMKREKILSRKSAEHRAMMVYLKLADDCLKARAALAEKNEEMSSREGDVYTLKRELVEKLRGYITEHYYTCTDEILRGLAAMYAGGGSMTENIDAAGGPGTGAFIAAAIRACCPS